jgi:hypothetical protein
MGTLLFVHGTGVREADYGLALDKAQRYAENRDGCPGVLLGRDRHPVAREWGEPSRR